jgi:hypothetical protein
MNGPERGKILVRAFEAHPQATADLTNLCSFLVQNRRETTTAFDTKPSRRAVYPRIGGLMQELFEKIISK